MCAPGYFTSYTPGLLAGDETVRHLSEQKSGEKTLEKDVLRANYFAQLWVAFPVTSA